LIDEEQTDFALRTLEECIREAKRRYNAEFAEQTELRESRGDPDERWPARDFVYTCGHQASHEPVNACRKARWRLFSRIIFAAVKWRAGRALNADAGWFA